MKKIGAIVAGVLVAVAAFVLYELGVITPDPRSDGGGSASGPMSAPSGEPSAEQALNKLDELRVEEESQASGYDRSAFPHWTSNVQDGCNTREAVLVRSGEGVEVGEDCDITSGTWHSAYDGETFTDPGDLDIDHMVPLKEGWRSGAHEWTTDKREQFANDMESDQLWAVSASSNRSKSDGDPSDWLPPLESMHCEYAVSWIEVKHVWDLSVDPDEEAALREVLASC
ncbi:HNH endonuclease family protein [Nocardiopsis algeriensis]|uniref:GmrSD restriction endonucleases C-terminal domain-containing protein n=1 Tax=Nocardiopsis algeriensis TaxID=1478215 RepID=A0A841IKT3_9ACTN|nr:hypothetical protein [Nocardiopsis algeriensis]